MFVNLNLLFIVSSHLASDIEIDGDLNCSSDLIFDGSIKGNINSQGSVVIGKNADVTGNVIAQTAVVEGKIDGCGEFSTCKLSATSVILGSVTTASLQMEEGASLSGQCKVGKSRGGAPAAKAEASAQTKANNSPSPKVAANKETSPANVAAGAGKPASEAAS